MKHIGFAILSDIGTWSPDGLTLKDSGDLSPEVAAAVAKVTDLRYRDGSTGVKIKLQDKLAALDKLAKLLGYYENDREDKDGPPIQVTA